VIAIAQEVLRNVRRQFVDDAVSSFESNGWVKVVRPLITDLINC
jgi:hypothetical protein